MTMRLTLFQQRREGVLTAHVFIMKSKPLIRNESPHSIIRPANVYRTNINIFLV